MNCPSLTDLARVGTPRADLAVVEHVQTCESCRLDWEIQLTTRYMLETDSDEAGDLRDVNERVMARITAIARQSDGPTRWSELVLSGLLVAVAVAAFLMTSTDTAVPIQVDHVALLAVGGGIGYALWCWKKDEEADEYTGNSGW